MVGIDGSNWVGRRYKLGEGMWAGWVLICGLGSGGYSPANRESLKVAVTRSYKMIVIATTDIYKHFHWKGMNTFSI